MVSLGYWDLAGSTGRLEMVVVWKAEQMVAGEICTQGGDKNCVKQKRPKMRAREVKNIRDQKHKS